MLYFADRDRIAGSSMFSPLTYFFCWWASWYYLLYLFLDIWTRKQWENHPSTSCYCRSAGNSSIRSFPIINSWSWTFILCKPVFGINMLFCYDVQKLGGNAMLVDAEHAFDPAYSKALGVDVENLIVCQPDHGEMALESNIFAFNIIGLECIR